MGILRYRAGSNKSLSCACDIITAGEKKMAQDNLETIRGLYAAFARGDVPTVLGALDAQVEWIEAENFIYADRNPYVGPQAVLDGVFMRLGAEWDGFSATAEQIVASGDTVIALGRYRGTYKATGRPVNAQLVHVFTLKDGKIIRFQQYTDTAQFRDVVARSVAAQG
jgi:ketosteroid isomerase-like protein